MKIKRPSLLQALMVLAAVGLIARLVLSRMTL
jgi:hypothetical protein